MADFNKKLIFILVLLPFLITNQVTPRPAINWTNNHRPNIDPDRTLLESYYERDRTQPPSTYYFLIGKNRLSDYVKQPEYTIDADMAALTYLGKRNVDVPFGGFF